jgi:cell wall-associated NlpC family hydrolase
MRCGVEVAPVRAEPHDGAEQVTQALRGEPLDTGERVGGWVCVTTAYGYSGWLREEQLCGEDPVSLARTFVGCPYEWGGLTAAGLDCSGLVHIAYRLSGRLVPRDSWQQEQAGAPVMPGSEQLGDLVTYGGERADHVAFWVGDGRILHATAREGLGVVEEPEPDELRTRRRHIVRLAANNANSA